MSEHLPISVQSLTKRSAYIRQPGIIITPRHKSTNFMSRTERSSRRTVMDSDLRTGRHRRLLWEKPLMAFDPDRFRNRKAIDRYAYLPFGDVREFVSVPPSRTGSRVYPLANIAITLRFNRSAGKDPNRSMDIDTCVPRAGVLIISATPACEPSACGPDRDSRTRNPYATGDTLNSDAGCSGYSSGRNYRGAFKKLLASPKAPSDLPVMIQAASRCSKRLSVNRMKLTRLAVRSTNWRRAFNNKLTLSGTGTSPAIVIKTPLRFAPQPSSFNLLVKQGTKGDIRISQTVMQHVHKWDQDRCPDRCENPAHTPIRAQVVRAQSFQSNSDGPT